MFEAILYWVVWWIQPVFHIPSFFSVVNFVNFKMEIRNSTKFARTKYTFKPFKYFIISKAAYNNYVDLEERIILL